eukprot:TRINITY_DN2932_c0_g1_i3.p1 TRINITY_DN2932_c0_g1~~TRINITY_DN2932_c0_g1_i3.p1  ORF type:complete len:642 (-),score=84.60 TRINITY_DN2932_c0_g1_i3:31-1794(-)
MAASFERSLHLHISNKSGASPNSGACRPSSLRNGASRCLSSSFINGSTQNRKVSLIKTASRDGSVRRRDDATIIKSMASTIPDRTTLKEYLEMIDDPMEAELRRRYWLPHVTDLNPQDTAMVSNFCTKTSCPLPVGQLDDDELQELGTDNLFVHDNDKVLLKVIKYSHPATAGAECLGDCDFLHHWLVRAGPRPRIYFEPSTVKAAIVTCGGLCPGLNDVIRQVVMTLDSYGVSQIKGIRYGYRGFFDKSFPPIDLSRDFVLSSHLMGGSLLGVSRGGSKTSDIVDSLQEGGFNMLFVIGGNGTHAGAQAIHEEAVSRSLKLAVVGIPKTIDNDILLVDKTFGFDTAVEEAQRAIHAAAIEARSAYRGVGIVKLMGRQSGFIAMHASFASGQVDVCLIPEVPFALEGPTGVLQHIEYLLERKGHAMICVAEGAGQDLLAGEGGTDASGNPILSDIGVHILKKIRKHFKEKGQPADCKYIDPTYMIRACRANASDSIVCAVLGQNAVHAAFAGYTGVTVGLVNTHYVYMPIPEVIKYARSVDPNGRMWHRCLTSTGQPDFMEDKKAEEEVEEEAEMAVNGAAVYVQPS